MNWLMRRARINRAEAEDALQTGALRALESGREFSLSWALYAAYDDIDARVKQRKAEEQASLGDDGDAVIIPFRYFDGETRYGDAYREEVNRKERESRARRKDRVNARRRELYAQNQAAGRTRRSA